MTHHIGYIHGSKLEPFSPPSFCRSGAGLEEYAYHYEKGYRQVTGKPCYHHAPEQKPERLAA
jgi:hypothetical protein